MAVMNLWEFSPDHQEFIVGVHLSQYGKIIGRLSTLHSVIYTISPNGNRRNRQMLIAKMPIVDTAFTTEQISYRLMRFLTEAVHIRNVCGHGLIHRFGHVEVIHGVPLLISPKRDLNLRDAIEEKPLALVDALAISIQIAHALAYCKTRGIKCHQDLRPENIFLDDISIKFNVPLSPPYRYQAFLADFDMANAAALFQKRTSSRPYMAAEQYCDYERVITNEFDCVDVFALGVNLYEMLTGGIHPIGERTSDVWPASTLGAKWGRDQIWKDWSRGKKRPPHHPLVVESGLSSLIDACLQPSRTERIEITMLELELVERLRTVDELASRALCENLKLLDVGAGLNDEEPWPYMEQMIKKIAAASDD